MEDPGSQEILLEFILLIVLTLLNAFFSATEMSMVSLNRSRVVQKEIKDTSVFLAFWNSPTISYPLFRWGSP